MADETISVGPDTTVIEGMPSQTEGVGGETAEGEPVTPEPLDPAYLARATTQYNMTEADLRAVPREVVERMMAGADRLRIEAMTREDRTPYQAPQSYPHQTQPPQPSERPRYTPYELKYGPEEAEVADSPLAKQMAAINKHIADQFGAVDQYYEQRLQSFNEFAQAQINQQHYAIIDRYVDSLGPEWSGVYGKGAALDMDSRTQEFSKRDELGKAALGLMRTTPGLSRDEALRRAHFAIHFDKASAIERAKADAKRKELQAQASDRPKPSSGGPSVNGVRNRAQTLLGMARR